MRHHDEVILWLTRHFDDLRPKERRLLQINTVGGHWAQNLISRTDKREHSDHKRLLNATGSTDLVRRVCQPKRRAEIVGYRGTQLRQPIMRRVVCCAVIYGRRGCSADMSWRVEVGVAGPQRNELRPASSELCNFRLDFSSELRSEGTRMQRSLHKDAIFR